MTHVQKVDAALLQIGGEVFPVYGSDAKGWSTIASDIGAEVPPGALYGSIDELFFALANLNACKEGLA